MAISGTYTFNPDVSELLEEAYERAGLEMRTGYDMQTARRSLNFLMLDWQNRGLNLWTVDQPAAITLNKGTSSYDIAVGTIGLLDVILRTDDGVVASQADYLLSRVSEPTYATIPNKLTQSRPLQYYFDRKEILDVESNGDDQASTITLWPVPDEDSKYEVLYWRVKRIADVGGDASNTMQVPGRFLPALVSGLAYHIAVKRPEVMSRVQFLKQDYEETYRMAADEDRVKTSARFVPHMASY
tara:strand:+ start:414 stop:1139 length:726 start_codon:yes stop_codon:yes gene_type:complete